MHYSSLSQQKTRESAVAENGGETVWSTSELYSGDGCYGFANALDGQFEYRR